MKHWAIVLGLCGICACAAAVRPAVLVEAAGFRQGRQAADAEKHAPQAFAHATEVERQAEERVAANDTRGAELLGERALGAYNLAFMLARLAKASDRELRAHAALDDAKKALATAEAQNVTLTAESKALEMRLNVVRDAVPLVPNPPADKAREAARREAARAMALQARMLCVGAQMLAPKLAALTQLFVDVDAVEKEVESGGPAPIDAATRARSGCLEALSTVRAPARTAAPAHSEADELLSRLSAAGYEPHRDDRGVVVTLRDVLQQGALTSAATGRVKELAAVAKAHPDVPVLVASHASGRAASRQAQEAADAVLQALESQGVAEVRGVTAGSALPLATPAMRNSQQLNTRVEIVFVSRSW